VSLPPPQSPSTGRGKLLCSGYGSDCVSFFLRGAKWHSCLSHPSTGRGRSLRSGVFSAVRYFDRYLLQFGPVSNHDHTSDYASHHVSSQVVKPIYSRLNYQEFLYNSIVDTFDSLKMWDMSHIFPATKN
jgi:hypothetical protein